MEWNILPDCTCYDCKERRKYQWVPPTDKERKMFMDAANNALDFSVKFWSDSVDFCMANHVDFDEFARIAESLAMDGM